MKIRITLKRTIQPPIDTRAYVDSISFDLDLSDDQNKILRDYVNGEDCKSCSFGIEPIAIQKIV